MELSKIVTSDPNKVTTLGFQGFRLLTVKDGVRSSLSWACRDGYPRATLVFNTSLYNPDANHDNYVSYPIDAIRLIAGLKEWLKLLRSGEDGSFCIVVSYDNRFIGKLGLVVSKGIPTIVATQDNTKQVAFNFIAKSNYVNYERNKTEVNMDKELAITYVECLIEEVKAASAMFMTSSVKDREPRPQQNGYRSRGNYQQQYNQPQQQVQQPIPQPQVTQEVPTQPVVEQPVQPQPAQQAPQQPSGQVEVNELTEELGI